MCLTIYVIRFKYHQYQSPNQHRASIWLSILFAVVNNVLPLKYINKLLNDLTKSLSESNFYDVEIRAGINENIKTFKAHSTILKARSSYFKVALSSNWIRKSEDNDNVILFEKENIPPNIFEVLLM